ncbi:MAG: carboxymuconolactone decarboxylase family protein [Bacteroidales bacterium]|jgi:AhpD family alkylhydroperoxidase
MIFKIPSYEDVSEEAHPLFDMLKKTSGKVPDLYATIGYSANALGSYLDFVQAQAKGSFHAKDREAVYLIVSQFNNCEYCLSAHTITAIRFGWTEKETVLLRAGEYPENKWKIIYSLIGSVIENKGEVNDQIINSFFNLGYDNKALIDMMALINLMCFTNYVYRLTKIPINIPLAKPLNNK